MDRKLRPHEMGQRTIFPSQAGHTLRPGERVNPPYDYNAYEETKYNNQFVPNTNYNQAPLNYGPQPPLNYGPQPVLNYGPNPEVIDFFESDVDEDGDEIDYENASTVSQQSDEMSFPESSDYEEDDGGHYVYNVDGSDDSDENESSRAINQEDGTFY